MRGRRKEKERRGAGPARDSNTASHSPPLRPLGFPVLLPPLGVGILSHPSPHPLSMSRASAANVSSLPLSGWGHEDPADVATNRDTAWSRSALIWAASSARWKTRKKKIGPSWATLGLSRRGHGRVVRAAMENVGERRGRPGVRRPGFSPLGHTPPCASASPCWRSVGNSGGRTLPNTPTASRAARASASFGPVLP